jgi:hypothetical protein
MRYSLRTLLILLTVGPALIAQVWWLNIDLVPILAAVAIYVLAVAISR